MEPAKVVGCKSVVTGFVQGVDEQLIRYQRFDAISFAINKIDIEAGMMYALVMTANPKYAKAAADEGMEMTTCKLDDKTTAYYIIISKRIDVREAGRE